MAPAAPVAKGGADGATAGGGGGKEKEGGAAAAEMSEAAKELEGVLAAHRTELATMVERALKAAAKKAGDPEAEPLKIKSPEDGGRQQEAAAARAAAAEEAAASEAAMTSAMAGAAAAATLGESE